MKWIFNYGEKILNKKQNKLQFQEITSIILKKHAQNKLKQIDNQEKIEAFLLELDLCAKITEGIVEINKNSVGMCITFTFEEMYILNDNEFFNTKLMIQLALELSESIVFTVEKERIKMKNYIRFCRWLANIVKCYWKFVLYYDIINSLYCI